MKKIILLLCITCAIKISFAQVEGVLVYENSYSNSLGTGKVTTTIYESKSQARVESINAETKSAIGSPSTQSQNVIIFDFDKSKETHLDAKRNTAYSTPFTITITDQQMKSLGTEITVKNLGKEKVRNYNCTHFAMITRYSKTKLPSSKRDIWITKDIGNGNVFYVGQYLYYPLGSSAAKKLTDASGDGVVVKWQIIDPVSKKPNVCTLLSYQKKSLPASTFLPPSGYRVVQR